MIKVTVTYSAMDSETFDADSAHVHDTYVRFVKKSPMNERIISIENARSISWVSR